MKPISFAYNSEGIATVAGHALIDLAKSFSTPLYVLDQDSIVNNSACFTDTLKQYYPNSKVLYACKANINVGLARLLDTQRLCFDVSSGGELYTVLKAGVLPEKIYFHGNNKSESELQFAIEKGCSIIIDNRHEFALIKKNAQLSKVPVRLLIRLKPEIDAHTHDYIKTGQLDSKFGVQKDIRLKELN